MGVIGNVSGSLATLIVAILELLDTTVDLGLYIGVIVHNKAKFSQSTPFIGRIVLFGAYIFLAFIAAILLIYSTLASKGLYLRKCICVGWITFRVLCFTLTILMIAAGRWWEEATLLTMCIVSMVMWVVFVGIVSYYTHKLNQAMEKRRIAAKKERGKRQSNVVAQHPPSKVPLPLPQPTKSQPWSKSQFQVIRNEHVFSTKRHF